MGVLVVLQLLKKWSICSTGTKNRCLINVKHSSLPSGGTFVSRSEDNISNHSMPYKAKFYLLLIKLLRWWYLTQNHIEALLKAHCLPLPGGLDSVSLGRNLYFNNLVDDFKTCQILKPSKSGQCQYNDRKQSPLLYSNNFIFKVD